MARLVNKSVGGGMLACVALISMLASARADEGPVIRDHRTQSDQPVIRDHRTQSNEPVVRDHRTGNDIPQSLGDADLVATLTKAADAALKGPDTHVKVNGHDFIVKQAKVSTFSGTLIITGQISHQLTARPDDQVYYIINKRGDTPKLVKFDIKRGGIASIVAYPSKLVNDAFGTSLATPIERTLRDLGAKIDGSWESSADLIVACIGLRARTWTEPSGTHGPANQRTPTETTTTTPSGPVVRDHR
jgi:hypothetical protein